MKQTCSRCGGTGIDPEISGCRCDCCDGTGLEGNDDETPAVPDRGNADTPLLRASGKREETLPPMYGTLVYRMMLADNLRGGWRTVWSGEGAAFGLWWAKFNPESRQWDVMRPYLRKDETEPPSSDSSRGGGA